MADFRASIDELEGSHTKGELVDLLAEKVGRKVTSVNPTTEAMFDRIAPNELPIEYARRSSYFSEEMQPVAKNALALKHLLHEQVGRPLYNRVVRLKKWGFAECSVAIDAHDEGVERAPGAHVPTTLPLDAEGFVEEPPERRQPTESPFQTIVTLDDGYEGRLTEWLAAAPDIANSSYFVYALDCTPAVGVEENPMLYDLRRAVATKAAHGVGTWSLGDGEGAAAALNRDHRVFYVGSTADIEKRVDEHVAGTAKSGVDFTSMVPPRHLVVVRGCDSRGEALRLEGDLAREIDHREGLFAYSDEM